MSLTLEMRADAFAEKAHEGQKRKWKGDPYIVHPRRVAARVAQVPGNTEEMRAAAKLHDTVEDCDVSLNTIELEFGETVAKLVCELTTPPNDGKNRAEKKAKEFARLAKVSDQAKIIKMCDRIDNLLDLDHSNDFARVYAKESLLLAEAVGDANRALKNELVEICKSILK